MKNIFGVLTLVISLLIGAETLAAQWVQQSSGSNAKLTDVVMLDTATAIAVGHDGSILKTINAGTSWSYRLQAVDFAPAWNSISFFDSMNGIVVGDESVAATTNGGERWNLHPLPGRGKCLSALPVGPTSYWVGDDSGWVYSTSDTGGTWTAEKISTWPIRSLFVYRGSPIVGVSKYALTPYSLCTQYVVPPPSWGESILTSFRGLGSEAVDAEYCKGGSSGFIVGVHGDLLSTPAIVRKTLSDTAWHEAAAGVSRPGALGGISAPSANVIYVCGTSGMMYKSSDGGDTWLGQAVPTTRNLNAISFCDEKHGFAVGDSGLILHTSTGGLTGIEDRKSFPPAKFELDQNYPNPFNPSTKISFSLPSRSFVSLKVFDLTGRQVAIIVSEEISSGKHARQWNADGFPSGIYFYRLQAGSFTETKKLLLIK